MLAQGLIKKRLLVRQKVEAQYGTTCMGGNALVKEVVQYVH